MSAGTFDLAQRVLVTLCAIYVVWSCVNRINIMAVPFTSWRWPLLYVSGAWWCVDMCIDAWHWAPLDGRDLVGIVAVVAHLWSTRMHWPDDRAHVLEVGK